MATPFGMCPVTRVHSVPQHTAKSKQSRKVCDVHLYSQKMTMVCACVCVCGGDGFESELFVMSVGEGLNINMRNAYTKR